VLNLTSPNGLTLQSSLTVNGTINCADAQLSLVSPTNTLSVTGTFNAGTGTVVLQGGTSATINGSITFNSLFIYGATTFTNTGCTVNSNFILSSATASVVGTNSFSYGNNSSLYYSTLSTNNPGLEWLANVPTGIGVPNNVIVSGGTTLVFNTGCNYRQATNTVNVDGTFSLTALNANLKIGGNFNVANGGTFNSVSNAVYLNGIGTQFLQKTLGVLTLDYLKIDKTGGTINLLSNITLLGTATSTLECLSHATIDLDNMLLTLNGAGTIVEANSNALTFTSSLNGSVKVIGSTSLQGNIIFDINTQIVTDILAAYTVNFQGTTINGSLYINHENTIVTGSINYGTGSTLGYTNFVTNRALLGSNQSEWTNALNIDNQPYNVYVDASVTLPNGQHFKTTNGLNIGTNGTLTVGTSQDITVGGNIAVTGFLVTSAGGNIELTGSNNQTINIQTTLDPSCQIALNKTAGTVKLTNDLTTIGGIDFAAGNTANFDLNGDYNVTLAATGLIQNEGADGKIVNTATSVTTGMGSVYATILNPPSLTPLPMGNIGIELQTSGSPTQIEIKRYPHAQANVGSSAGIKRVYEVNVTPASQLTVTYSYFDTELGIIDDNNASFNMFESPAQTGVYVNSAATVNASLNTIFQSYASVGNRFFAAGSDGAVTITSTTVGGDWSLGSTWVGGVSPINIVSPAISVIIAGPVNVDLAFNDGNESVEDLTVNALKTLTFATNSGLYVKSGIDNNGTISMNANSNLVLANTGVLDNGTGAFTANNTSTVSFEGGGSLNGSAT